MERIHNVTPVLKTLFRFGIPKPKSQQYRAEPLAKSEDMILLVLFYDTMIANTLFSEENWPPYIIRYMHSEDPNGYVTFDEKSRPEWKLRLGFAGTKVLIELDPMYDKALVIGDLYIRLRAIGEQYAEYAGLTVDWDENYAYVESHIGGMMPIMATPKK